MAKETNKKGVISLLLRCAIIGILLGIDQLIKWWAKSELQPVGEMDFLIIGNVDILHLTYVENTGMAFSTLSGKTSFLILTTLIGLSVLGVILFHFAKNTVLKTGLTLCVAGGLGNLVDRIFCEGAVVDYIDIQLFHFAVFNFADCLITIGTVILFVYILFIMDSDKKGKKVKSHGTA